MYPNVLVVSNCCFSKMDSNGRTLSNFFIGWPKDNIAQFYLQNAVPDFDICENYFRMTDKQALKSIFWKKYGGKLCETDFNDNEKKSTDQVNKNKRNAVTMLLRNFVWNTGRWKKSGFNSWVEDFAPDMVLLQAGDSPFMFKLARKTALQHKIPLVIYNSEGYYFFKFDYFNAKGIAHLFYPLFRQCLCRQFRKAQSLSSFNFYSCEALKEDFAKEFNTKSEVIYISTELFSEKKNPNEKEFNISYLGNIGVGRHKPLLEFAETLRSISSGYSLDVYGKFPNEDIKNEVVRCETLNYQGVVSYDDVINIIKSSDVIIHIENFDPFYLEYVKYGFSTKIADSLASGVCFLIYAPETIACCKYLKENDLAYVATNKEELKEILTELINNPQSRLKYIDNAFSAVEKNHRAEVNAKKFQEKLIEIAGGKL